MTPPPLFAHPDNPLPDGGVLVPLKAPDGLVLRAARFPAARDAAFKGTVCLFAGRGEFIEKYFETICDLTARGFDVASMDWRGQGGSKAKGSRRGHIKSFDTFQRDIDVFMEDFVRPDCRPPYFALAHSMGGALILEAARRRTTWWERVVLSAPMIGLPGLAGGPLVQRLAALSGLTGLGQLYVPGGSARSSYSGRFENNVLTGDHKRFTRVQTLEHAAPHLVLGAPTLGWLNAAGRAMATFGDPERVAQIRTPTLFVAAGDERVVSNRAMTLLASQMRTAKVVTLPSARHELMMERNAVRNAFFAAFEAFVPGTPTFPD
ncbi:alpha/beta hydrolase [Terrihabitans rhizophilus]|uniref:Alpha/beta hydrolase n=1 Tax=Terrihabitans rhizophilus TaxID=3092662 RepID=A0ABU4RP90_9HYPH|nr:alpha/beta hydrolase [Terrihabitans sp. PJ23]MDX6806660.1 alpha/beta hydrolase [Terrihabitans sp. PJ23]